MNRRGKIIATIGPVSQEEKVLSDLLLAGANVFRLNFSHGSHASHLPLIKRIRSLEKSSGKPIGILQDLQGPKIRIGELNQEEIQLEPGQIIKLTSEPITKADEITIDFPELSKYVRPKKKILIDDGKIELSVNKIKGNQVETTVVTGGILKSNKGINLPGTCLDIPSFTPKDEEDLVFGLKHNVDAVAISFVQRASDITLVKEKIRKLAPEKTDTLIIAKMERPEALNNLDEIIDVADGVMVARGDLGVEMPPESVPIAQKRIIEAANKNGKIVITATQMLDSMIHNPRPTRAEATDVANAIFDGTDAVMLSGETAIGKFPKKSVEMMNSIIKESEENLKSWGRWQGTSYAAAGDDAAAITQAAKELAHDLYVAAIAVFTQTGRTARLMSKTLPRVPILGFTPNQRTFRRMTLYWGVFPLMVPFANTMEEMLAHVDAAMIESTPIKPGQQVVVISGFPVGERSLPNFALLYTVGQKQ